MATAHPPAHEIAPRDRIIVALDVPDLPRLSDYLDRLEGRPAFYKIGLELFIAEGERAVELVQKRDGRLFLYGPFKRDGKHTALSNAVFDTSLRDRDAEWGVRDITDVEKLGLSEGLALIETVPMPANNLILVFERRHSIGSD